MSVLVPFCFEMAVSSTWLQSRQQAEVSFEGVMYVWDGSQAVG